MASLNKRTENGVDYLYLNIGSTAIGISSKWQLMLYAVTHSNCYVERVAFGPFYFTRVVVFCK